MDRNVSVEVLRDRPPTYKLRRTVVITSNRPVQVWGKDLADATSDKTVWTESCRWAMLGSRARAPVRT